MSLHDLMINDPITISVCRSKNAKTILMIIDSLSSLLPMIVISRSQYLSHTIRVDNNFTLFGFATIGQHDRIHAEMRS